MTSVLYLAWRYLRYQRLKTLLLVASITLVLFLPAGLQVLVTGSSRHLLARAETTPLVVGNKGSELELVLNTLYFESRRPPTLPYSQAQRVAQSGLATAIPVYCRFNARRVPIVGTSLEYFQLRGLEPAAGRLPGMLGECLAGSQAAERLGIEPGDSILSSPETLFDLAGVYPLKMRCVGVLEPTGGPDDRVLFVDVRTTWIIEGLGHGHQDLADPAQQDQILRREENEITANASVLQFTEITPENAGSFHFHGDIGTFPLTAVIAVPHDDKSETLLLGRYQGQDEPMQIVQPTDVMRRLVDTIFTIRSYLLLAAALVALATMLSASLIFLLSIRLRQPEMETLVKIGASRARVAVILASEIVMVLATSAALAAVLTWSTAQLSQQAIRWILL